MARADFAPPFEFYSELLGRGRGRAKLLHRLGPEAADPIDEFLGLALAHQNNQAPSLQGFLHWLAVGEPVIKRELEQTPRNEVRILTVHGAKGLQAPIVYLPDTTFDPLQRHEPTVPAAVDGHGLLIWRASAIDSDEKADELHRERQARRREENNRLLYVAMTRAADRLYVCGCKGKKEIPASCWYRLVQGALDRNAIDASERTPPELIPVRLPFTLGRELIGDGQIAGEMVRLDNDDRWRAPAPAPGLGLAREGLPDWALQAPSPEPVPPRPLAPSRSEGDAAAEVAEPAALSPLEQDGSLRFRRGLIIHRLLQLLPELPVDQRHAAALRFLARTALDLDPEQQRLWAEETLAVLHDPNFAPLFGPGSRAEVALAGTIEGHHGPYVVSGQIDRLLVTPERILVIDYKTNRPPPKTVSGVPALYLRQMAAYRALLQKIWPGRMVEGALLWTDGAFLMALPPELLDAHKP
jgi:ATP-dependent helicase/nuclease subunit A